MSDLPGFFRHTLSGLVAGRDQRPLCTPFLAVDECSNHPAVSALCTDLVGRGIVSTASPVWIEYRILATGELMTVMGGVPPLEERRMDYGAPAKHRGYSDREVVDYTIAQFCSHDRIALLTENTKRNVDGLWRVLHKEVAPLISDFGQGRLGLVLLAKRGKSTYDAYTKSVHAHLTQVGVPAGFSSSILPQAA